MNRAIDIDSGSSGMGQLHIQGQVVYRNPDGSVEIYWPKLDPSDYQGRLSQLIALNPWPSLLLALVLGGVISRKL